MATLAISNNEIYAALGHLLGVSRDSSDWDTDTSADVDRIIRSGRRRFFSAHQWRFLTAAYAQLTSAPYNTGTVTVVDGVVTLSVAGTFPSNATQYMFVPDGGGAYTIASRDGDNQITLNNTSLDVDAGSSYNLYQYVYDLPSDFAVWEGPLTVENNSVVKESRNFPEYVIRSMLSFKTVRTGKPTLFNVISSTNSETGISTWTLQLYPLPDDAYLLQSRYRIQPGDTLSEDPADPVTDSIFSECMLESILSAAEIIAFDAPGVHTARFQELLSEAIRRDGRIPGVRLGRPRTLRDTRPANYELIVAPVTIEE